jgi:hypothetical protein
MKLSARARRALDELWAVRAECEQASTTLARYGRRHPTREADYQHAAILAEQAAEMIGHSLDDFIGMTTLLNFEEAERRADAEAPPDVRGTVGRREMECV